MSVKVLIVDDEKSIVKGLKYALEADGMLTDAAYDGEEALEKIETGEFDLILLDMMLPKMDGMEVCRQVRSFSDVPIVFLTAKGDDMDKILGLESGADDYITKPFNMLEVRARIRGIIRRSKTRVPKPEKKETLNHTKCCFSRSYKPTYSVPSFPSIPNLFRKYSRLTRPAIVAYPSLFSSSFNCRMTR